MQPTGQLKTGIAPPCLQGFFQPDERVSPHLSLLSPVSFCIEASCRIVEKAEAYRRWESVQQSTGKSYTAGIRGVFFQRGMTEQCLFQCLLPEIGIPAGKLPESGHVFFQSRIFLPQ